MSAIEIRKMSIVDADTDAVVNAANEGLWAGGGVCGAIFRAAGYDELEKACGRIGHCDTGSAVITPGFRLKARYIIHAVGPVWIDGLHGESGRLYDAYFNSLGLVAENDCTSVTFPLISAGIYGYPIVQAWQRALAACGDYLDKNPGRSIRIVFAVLSDEILSAGKRALTKSKAAKYGVSQTSGQGDF